MGTSASILRLKASQVAHAVRLGSRERYPEVGPFRGILTGVILGTLVWLSAIILLLELR